MDDVFPGKEWEWVEPKDAGFDPAKLEEARRWLVGVADEKPYRVVLARGGRIVAEWEQGLATDDRLNLASATKSLFSSMLGIAIAEGKIGSAVGTPSPRTLELPSANSSATPQAT